VDGPAAAPRLYRGGFVSKFSPARALSGVVGDTIARY
jgi:hypothetical protein